MTQFWAGAVIGIVASWGGIFIKEWFAARTQVKLERLKLYEADLLKAYRSLYDFVSLAYSSLYPPNEPSKDFRDLMKYSYFRNVKPNMLLFEPSIREQLKILERPYECLGDPDLIPPKPFDDFFKEDIGQFLQRLANTVENKSDRVLHGES
jgi:hypothetical protein